MRGKEKEIKLEKINKKHTLHGLADLHWAAQTKHTPSVHKRGLLWDLRGVPRKSNNDLHSPTFTMIAPSSRRSSSLGQVVPPQMSGETTS
jgi:hypothetical protein